MLRPIFALVRRGFAMPSSLRGPKLRPHFSIPAFPSMIAKLIAPFAQVSGKQASPGGTIANSAVVAMPDNYGRTLLRNWVLPANPKTAMQSQIRSSMTSVAEAMQSLSQPQADAWKAIADGIVRSGRLGQNYRLSWTALFQSVNSYRLQDGQAVTLEAPALDTATIPARVTAVFTDDGDPTQNVEIATEDPTPTALSRLAIRFTRNLGSQVRQARDTDFRYAAATTASILPRLGADGVYAIETTGLNILSSTWIGVLITVLTPNGYPAGRLMVRNIGVANH